MDWNTIIIASITGALPTIGLITSQLITSKGKTKESLNMANIEVYKDNIKSRINAYQSLISTSKDLRYRFDSCLFVFDITDYKDKSVTHDAVTYKDIHHFFKHTFLNQFQEYSIIEKNNIIYVSKVVLDEINILTSLILDMNELLSRVANNSFKIDDVINYKAFELSEKFDFQIKKVITLIMDELDSLSTI